MINIDGLEQDAKDCIEEKQELFVIHPVTLLALIARLRAAERVATALQEWSRDPSSGIQEVIDDIVPLAFGEQP